MENTITFTALTVKYLAWCGKHRSPRSLEWYEGHIANFLAHLGDNANMDAMALRPYHIVEWLDSRPTWGNTFKGGAVSAIKRVFNWASELGYIDDTPIRKLKKPPAQRREIYMTPEDYKQIFGLINKGDPFLRFLIFVWGTGCRPQEARHIEPRHVDLVHERIVFPAEESKGKRAKRIIYLHGDPLKIIQRLMLNRKDDGKLFRNTDGNPWTKYAICNRFHRYSKITGKRMFCYAARHGFGTRKVIQGKDMLTIAALMGHTDGSMLAKVYSHVADNAEHLKAALVD